MTCPAKICENGSGSDVTCDSFRTRTSQPSSVSFVKKMDSGTCAAPDGSIKTWSLSPQLATLIVSIIGFGPIIIFLLGPKLVFLIGGWVGNYLKRQTANRRKEILELKEAEEERWRSVNKKEREESSEEWEKVEDRSDGSAVGVKTQGFDGVIGFFHPFW